MSAAAGIRTKEVAKAFAWPFSARLWVLLAALAVFLLIGGGSRNDSLALLVLRPASMLLLAYAVWVTRTNSTSLSRFGAAGFALLFAIHVFHLLPMPPSIWTTLPGREQIVENFASAQVQLGWRPLTFVPFATWNSLFALAAPFAVWLLASTLQSSRSHASVVSLVCIIALLSVFLGVLQTLSPPNSPVYFHRLTNNGLAVGFFANRNHNAAFLACAIPMIGYVIARLKQMGLSRPIAATLLWGSVSLISIAVFLTGSRAGLFLLLLGIASLWFFRVSREEVKRKENKVVLWLLAASALLLLIVTVIVPTNSLTRLFEADLGDELRFEVWPVIWADLWRYFPVGSGMGAFVETYQLAEPDGLLRSSYLNHAHNDWLELLSDAGIFGGVVLAIGLAGWTRGAARVLQRRSTQLQTLGVIVIGLLAIGSFVDYPLRTPSLSVLFALAMVWAFARSEKSDFARREGSVPPQLRSHLDDD